MSSSSRPGLVFISYKREEADKAAPLREALLEEGFNVYWDEDLQCGQAWAEKLDEAVRDAACIIVLWSERSVASQWLRHEASQAIAREVYAPCRIELVQLESPYDRIQATDLIDWDGDRESAGFRNLLERVDALVPALVPLPRRIGCWLRANLATLVASSIAVFAIFLLLTIFLEQREYRREKVYDCSTGAEFRFALAREIHSKKQSLARVCLRGVSLYNADLSKAILQGANLSEVDLRRANLSGANLSGANLHRADLRATNLSGANLREAVLTEVNLMKTDLQEVIFVGADLSGADLRATNLSRANLYGADLYKAKFSQADLTGATLAGADLSEADFSRANLTRADLERTKLARADAQGPNLSDANLTEARLNGANLSGANLSRANLSRARLMGADLSGANLSRANLSRTKLIGADFSRASLRAVNLSGAEILANFSGADLSGAILTGAHLGPSNLSGANLTGACADRPPTPWPQDAPLPLCSSGEEQEGE